MIKSILVILMKEYHQANNLEGLYGKQGTESQHEEDQTHGIWPLVLPPLALVKMMFLSKFDDDWTKTVAPSVPTS